MSAGRVLGGGLILSGEIVDVEEVEGTVAGESGCAEEDGRVCVFEDEGEA